jgi:chromate transporter
MSLAELVALILSFNLLTFGNGPVMVPLLQRHLVQDAHALTLDQFLYAFAIGRATPGQANLYVAAIGYMTYGLAGAVATTVAVALPGYLALPLVKGYERFREVRAVQGFIRGLTCVSVGLMLDAVIDIGRATLVGAAPAVAFAATLGLVLLLRWNALLAMLAASAAGLAVRLALPG